MLKAHLMSGGRYPVLRSLAILYLIGACVAVLAGIVAVVWTLGWGPGSAGDRLLITLGAIAATFFVAISMLAIAEVLKLFIDLEHNSRIAALGLAHTATSASTMTESERSNRISVLDEETAEAALLRGH
jgi:hypothetical protein